MPDLQAKILTGHLNDVSLMYKNQSYINEMVFPLLDLNTNKGKITVYNKGDMFRDEASLRARLGEAKTIDWKTSEVDVNTSPYALKGGISDLDLEAEGYDIGAKPPVDMVQDTIQNVTDAIDRSREKRVADSIFAANWSGDGAGGLDATGTWNHTAGTNTFLTDVYDSIKELLGNGIPDPQNLHLAIDWGTYLEIDRIPEVRDRLKYTSSEPISLQALASLLKIGSVMVGGARVSTAVEAADGSDFTPQYVWEKNQDKGSAFLFYRGPSKGRRIMQAGYQPRTKKVNGSMRITKEYRIEEKAAWFYEVEESTGIQVVAADAGKLWVDTIQT